MTMSSPGGGSDAWVTLVLIVTATVVALYDLVLLMVAAT